MKYDAESNLMMAQPTLTDDAPAGNSASLEGGRVLAVTSATHGEGVSTVTRRLGQGLCGQLGDAIVVDTNLRAGWGLPVSSPGRRPGLTEVLLNDAPFDSVIDVDVPRQLHLMPSGSGTPNASAMLASGALQRCVQQLRQRYRWVLLDMPPVGVYPDAGAIGRIADGVILVVQAEWTRADVVAQAQRALLRGGGRVLGSVLNRRRHHIPDWLYHIL